MINPAAYRLYLIYSASSWFLFNLIFTVMTVYRVQVAGLNPLQLVLVGTTLEVTYFLFNVPTGVVADTYSRRLSVIIGVLLFGVGAVLEGSVPVFTAILVTQVIQGLGYTFVEGALEAWIADEVGEEHLGAVFLRGSQVGSMAGFVGIFASVGLASYRLAAPILLGGALFLVFGVYLMFKMHEPHFRRPTRQEAQGARARVHRSLREMNTTVRDAGTVVRHRPLALTLLAVALVFGGFSEGLDRLGDAHLLLNFGFPSLGNLEPVVWFGIISAAGMLLSIGATELVVRRLDTQSATNKVRALLVLTVVLIGSIVAFALVRSFGLAVGALLVAGVMRSLHGPLYGAWLNQNVDPRVRATVISMSAQADAVGQFTVGPTLGVLGTVYGLRTAIAAAGLALSPALALYGRALRRGGTSTAAREAAASASES